MVSRIYSSLSLATKAGMTESGAFCTEQAVKRGRACLVLTAQDAAENTKKMFRDMCAYYNVPYRNYGTKGELGHAMGVDERAVLAVTDEGFAKKIEAQLETEGIGGDRLV